MASIRYSATGGEIKGKIGGSVYQGGKSGTIVKQLIKRSFVRVLTLIYGMAGSDFTWEGCMALSTSAIRCKVYADGSHHKTDSILTRTTALATLASSWRELTPSQRTAWNAAAVNFPFKNKFGDTYTGSGFQCYMQLNSNLQLINVPVNVFPPAANTPILPTIESPAETGADAMQYNFPDGIPTGQQILVYSAPGQSAGKDTAGRNLKLIAVLDSVSSATSFNLRYMWQTFFGMLNANTNITFKFVPVDTTNGVQGAASVKAELIDAIACGAKLTKADASVSFPVDVYTTPVEVSTSFFAYNWGTKARLLITGTNAAEIEISIDGGANFGNPADVFTNGWLNIPPTEVILRANWTSAGSKSANLEYQTAAGVTVTTCTITGNPTT